MKLYRFSLYLYLVFGLYILYDSYIKFQAGENYYVSLAFTAVALFMFFFRKRHIKKIEDSQKKE